MDKDFIYLFIFIHSFTQYFKACHNQKKMVY